MQNIKPNKTPSPPPSPTTQSSSNFTIVQVRASDELPAQQSAPAFSPRSLTRYDLLANIASTSSSLQAQSSRTGNAIADFMLGKRAAKAGFDLRVYISNFDQTTRASSSTAANLFPLEKERLSVASADLATRQLFTQNAALPKAHLNIAQQILSHFDLQIGSSDNSVSLSNSFNPSNTLWLQPNGANSRAMLKRMIKSLFMLNNQSLATNLQQVILSLMQQHSTAIYATESSAFLTIFDHIAPLSTADRSPSPAASGVNPLLQAPFLTESFNAYLQARQIDLSFEAVDLMQQRRGELVEVENRLDMLQQEINALSDRSAQDLSVSAIALELEQIIQGQSDELSMVREELTTIFTDIFSSQDPEKLAFEKDDYPVISMNIDERLELQTKLITIMQQANQLLATARSYQSAPSVAFSNSSSSSDEESATEAILRPDSSISISPAETEPVSSQASEREVDRDSIPSPTSSIGLINISDDEDTQTARTMAAVTDSSGDEDIPLGAEFFSPLPEPEPSRKYGLVTFLGRKAFDTAGEIQATTAEFERFELEQSAAENILFVSPLRREFPFFLGEESSSQPEQSPLEKQLSKISRWLSKNAGIATVKESEATPFSDKSIEQKQQEMSELAALILAQRQEYKTFKQQKNRYAAEKIKKEYRQNMRLFLTMLVSEKARKIQADYQLRYLSALDREEQSEDVKAQLVRLMAEAQQSRSEAAKLALYAEEEINSLAVQTKISARRLHERAKTSALTIVSGDTISHMQLLLSQQDEITFELEKIDQTSERGVFLARNLFETQKLIKLRSDQLRELDEKLGIEITDL